jgi:exodeoxyribonuclease V beta subunit
MPGFDVLDPALNVSESRFIEASAGTGKTFTLQHLIVRLILSSVPLERILVVTFTRAATMDLRRRVRETLIEIIDSLGKGESPYPYVQEIIEKGDLKHSLRQLRLALSCFEEAKIYTIHSFCFQVLQESAFDVGLSFFDRSEESSQSVLKETIKDLFRSPLGLTAKQLKKLFAWGKNIEDVSGRILRQIQGRSPIEVHPELRVVNDAIKEKRVELLRLYPSEVLREAFYELVPNFGKCTNREKERKPEIQIAIEKLLSGDDLVDTPLLLISRNNLLKRASPEILEKWNMLLDHLESLWELVLEAQDELKIFAHVAEKARRKVLQLIEEKELLYFDDLILKVEKEIDSAPFREKVQSHFDAVLIDEFQDTNPGQWRIFSTLFGKEFLGPLVLVGDPKQAIYRFRQADIYTYLNARESFTQDQRVELIRNYRSVPPLIHALNALFAQKNPLLKLPKTGQSISYTPVESDLNKESPQWHDGKSSVVVINGSDEECLLKHCLWEVSQINQNEKIPLSECAFLVKDRYQAMRLQQLCREYQIPVHLKGQQSLIESPTFGWLELFLHIVVSPQDDERIKRILGTPLFGLAPEELSFHLAHYQEFFYRAHQVLYKGGLFSLYTFWKQEEGKHLMKQGEMLYGEWEQLFEALAQKNPSLTSLFSYLEELKQGPYEEELFLAKSSLSRDALQVMTLHVSKGLEYDVVFPVGLTLPPPKKRELVFDEERGAYTLDESACALHDLELEAERQRQLYVALTRPKKRLYLPFLPEEEHSPLAKFLDGCSLDLGGVSAVEAHQKPSLWNPIGEKEPEWNFNPNKLPLYPSKRIESFSSLYPLEEVLEKKVEPSFPAGPEVGTLIHTLLEKLPLHQVAAWNDQQWKVFADPFLKGTILEEFYEEITKLLARAAQTPFPEIGPLCSVDPKKIIKELPFLYETEEGLMKGFIDLVVESNNIFYVIDWKSNALDCYDQAAMEIEAAHHHYEKQAAIYKEGMKRYLSLFEQPYKIGPAFYCFLRGLEPQRGLLCL